ncbi:hypothetical protein EPHNCH_0534 [Anaplasma phagocytophilum str. NCH-1]|uniref:Uncharacterized protein n=1 Tax=Anaplasma phagocytophilum str. NCH-1 TaxID=1359161 RepID=A0A0F3NK24_ANAPH|nr:hypothetical protein EPHNCH_0534 [Anaplasma phagocytophilum str. NCH-1]
MCIVTCVALALTKKLKKSPFRADTTDGPCSTEKESEYLSNEQ